MLTRVGLLCLSALLPSGQAFLTAVPRPQLVSGHGPAAGSLAANGLPAHGRWGQCVSKLQSTATAIAESELSEVDKMSPPSTFFECILQVRHPHGA